MNEKKKRSYLCGFLFSWLCPGLGHVYTGKIKIGIILFIITTILSILYFSGLFVTSAYTYIASVAALIIWTLAIAVHCLIHIKKERSIILRPYNKWYFYILFIFVFFGISVFSPSSFETFHIPSEAMAPTLQTGDYILTKYSSEVDRGDIVVFKYPKNPKLNHVKRVIGLPGDEIEIRNKIVHVNGQPLPAKRIEVSDIRRLVSEKFRQYNFDLLDTRTGDAKHKILLDKDNVYLRDHAKVEVPPKNYFVLGDNRDYSADSRIWGFVPHENIFAKPVFIFFSKDKNNSFKRFDMPIN